MSDGSCAVSHPSCGRSSNDSGPRESSSTTELPERRLDEFLFRRARLDAARVRLALFELQEGRCFYTNRPFRASQTPTSITSCRGRDHRSTRSRIWSSPIGAINGNKSDHLAAAESREPMAPTESLARRRSPDGRRRQPVGVRGGRDGGSARERSISRWVRQTSSGSHAITSSAAELNAAAARARVNPSMTRQQRMTPPR